jgi:hypothetical protein
LSGGAYYINYDAEPESYDAEHKNKDALSLNYGASS